MIFETNLPGSSIQVIDEYNTTSYDTSEFGTTESVLVIGTAFDGPAGKEVAIYNPDHAKYIFGGTYDSSARRSASLVAYIQDLYEKGCRTIYAMRVGGKEITKTYRLREDVPVYLRVSGAFPSNKYKDMAVLVDQEAGKFIIYKTANKATIEEKREGIVESSESIIQVSVNIDNPYGYNKNSSLSEFIEYMNTYTKNNVFNFALVDEKGIDITYSSLAQSLSIGALFSGIYTIGRQNRSADVATTLEVITTLPAYNTYNSPVVFELKANSDVEAMFPITRNDYDFLKQYGGLDNFSKKDSVDYEEVNMSKFEFYKRLGNGFAQTAKLSKAGARYIVKPTASTDPLYTAEIGEGIYTVASNLKTDYRILTGVYADDVITGVKLTAKDFLKENIAKIKVAHSNVADESDILQNVVSAYATYKLDDDKETKYAFKVKTVESIEALSVASLKANLVAGVKPLADLTTLEEGKYAIVEAENAYWVAQSNAEGQIEVVMPLNMVGQTELDYNIQLVQSAEAVTYEVSVVEDFAEITSAYEFAELLNNSIVGQVFAIACDNKYANELIIATPGEPVPQACREVNENLDIALPYTTSDNFARQFAQHCEYTSLKTYQTHGVLGVKPLNDTSIRAVAEKCNALVEKDYDLYVKNATGRAVLDVDNLPYHIGKSISIVTTQHTIQTLDGYKFTATGQSSYVARASILDRSVSTTNQVIPITPHYTFGESQKVSLNKAGYVTIEYKDSAYKVTDGVTKAPIYSQFARFATFRTIKVVDQVIRQATEPFIGKKNDMTNRNSMYTAIKSGMDGLLSTYLEQYEFNMRYNKYDARLGEINIDYTIDIIDEIRNVNNTVRAKA